MESARRLDFIALSGMPAAAKPLRELGHDCRMPGIAHDYRDLIDGIVIDEIGRDMATQIGAMGMTVAIEHTVMGTDSDKEHLAARTLALAQRLARPMAEA